MHYYIPMGPNCSIATFLKDNGIRHHSFPFDWTLVPVSSTIDLFENQFQDFLNPANLEALPVIRDRIFGGETDDLQRFEFTKLTPVFDKVSGTLFIHDFEEYNAETLSEIQDKYTRRINRLHSLLSDDGNSFTIVVHDKATLDAWWQPLYAKHNIVFDPPTGWKERIENICKTQYPTTSVNVCSFKELEHEVAQQCLRVD